MSCDRYEALICRLPDGDLTDAEAAELKAHLRTCPDCRRLLRAMEAVTNDLDETADPPAALAAGVMDRIREDRAVPDRAVSKRLDATRRRKSARKRRWRSAGVIVGAAAMVALVFGGGGYLASRLLGSMGSSSVSQSASVDAGVMTVEAAEEPAALLPMPDEAPMAAAYGANDADAPAAEEAFMDAAAPEAARSVLYTWEHPAQVPEARTAEFETLVTDIGWPDGLPDASWQVICAVEYEGVIYEFLTDPQEQYLLWRDAAESAGHFHSPGSVAQLWDILGE